MKLPPIANPASIRVSSRLMKCLHLLLLAGMATCATPGQAAPKAPVAQASQPKIFIRHPAPSVTLGKPVLMVDGVQEKGVSTVALKDIASTIFDHAALELPEAGEPLSKTWTGELVYPVQSESKQSFEVSYKADLRYFIYKQKGSVASVGGTIGGQPFTEKFAAGKAVGGRDLLRTQSGKLKLKDGGEFRIKIELGATQTKTGGQVLVNFDSIDIRFN